MENEKHRLAKTNNAATSSSSWLNLLMAKAIVKQQFRNAAYSPTLEQKREVLEDWSRLANRLGRGRFTEGLMEAFTHTTFIPSCADIEQWAPQQVSENQMYQPFPVLEAPKDPVDDATLERFNAKVREICEGKVMPKKHAERAELHEVQSKGMKAKIVDRKAEAANDK
jgi:hypothetical protein